MCALEICGAKTTLALALLLAPSTQTIFRFIPMLTTTQRDVYCIAPTATSQIKTTACAGPTLSIALTGGAILTTTAVPPSARALVLGILSEIT